MREASAGAYLAAATAFLTARRQFKFLRSIMSASAVLWFGRTSGAPALPLLPPARTLDGVEVPFFGDLELGVDGRLPAGGSGLVPLGPAPPPLLRRAQSRGGQVAYVEKNGGKIRTTSNALEPERRERLATGLTAQGPVRARGGARRLCGL